MFSWYRYRGYFTMALEVTRPGHCYTITILHWLSIYTSMKHSSYHYSLCNTLKTSLINLIKNWYYTDIILCGSRDCWSQWKMEPSYATTWATYLDPGDGQLDNCGHNSCLEANLGKWLKKTFFFITDGLENKLERLSLSIFFQSSLIFMNKVGAALWRWL